jgi:hypothetical protein
MGFVFWTKARLLGQVILLCQGGGLDRPEVAPITGKYELQDTT